MSYLDTSFDHYIKLLESISLKNKYFQVYVNLCYRATTRNLNTYTEKHHILPKSYLLGGEKDANNLVILTAREHFIAHKLLCKFASNEFFRQKSLHALAAFYLSNKWHDRSSINSRSIEEAKKARSLAMRGDNNYFKTHKFVGANNHFYGKKHSQKTIQHFKDVRIGISYDELYGKIIADDIKNKQSIARIGENNSFYGKKHSPDSIQKMRNFRGYSDVIEFDGVKYQSITSMSSEFNVSRDAIKNLLSGKTTLEVMKSNHTKRIGYSVKIDNKIYNSIKCASRELEIPITIVKKIKNGVITLSEYQYQLQNPWFILDGVKYKNKKEAMTILGINHYAMQNILSGNTTIKEAQENSRKYKISK